MTGDDTRLPYGRPGVRPTAPPAHAQRATRRALAHLLDEHVGIILSLRRRRARRDDPQFAHVEARLADITRITGRPCSRGAGGTGLEEESALAKAVGEAVERYCVGMYAPEAVRLPVREAGARAIDPRSFALFHPRQYELPGFPYARVRDDTTVEWVEGFSLTRRRAVLVPASLVQLADAPGTAPARFGACPVSGYACGDSAEEATLRGIYEVVERDAFMVSWYNRLPGRPLDLSASAAPELRRTLERFSTVPAQVFCLDITTDAGIPSVLALMISARPGRPAAVAATAADLDAERAAARALQELASNNLFVRSLCEAEPHRVPRTPAEVRDPEGHGLFYAARENLRHLEHLLRPSAPALALGRGPTPRVVGEKIETCVRRLAEAGLEAVVVDITAPDVGALGLSVVKVLIPGAQPLDFAGQWPHLGGRRLYEAPARMGRGPAAPGPWALNLFPHPFP